MLKFTETIVDRNGRCKRIIQSDQLTDEECVAIVEMMCGIQRHYPDDDLEDMEEEFASQLVEGVVKDDVADEMEALRKRVDYLEGVVAGKHLKKETE